MRIIDYFNIGAIFVYSAAVLLYLIKKPRQRQNSSAPLSPGWEAVLFTLLLGIGIFLRFYRLATMPEGFQQDEASNAYEAYALAFYGMDRNGYRYPIYPITWGSGGGSPFLLYFSALIIRIFGPSILTFRAIIASFGIAALMLFYIYIRKLYGNKTALIGLGAFAVMPWHVVLSRWLLDCNTIPFWVILIVLLFLISNQTQKTSFYIITAVICGVCLYCYGSSTVVIPLFLLFLCCYSLYTKRLNVKQLIFSGIAFLITVAPLAVFYIINFFDLPAITTEHFSIPKFVSNHTGSVFIAFDKNLPGKLWDNVIHLLKMLTIGCEDEAVNYVPGYFTLYHFTFPVTFLGIYAGFKDIFRNFRKRIYSFHAPMACMLLASVLFSLFITQNINRMIFLFLPLIYFFVTGVDAIRCHSKYLFAILVLILGLGSASFTKDYFTEYNQTTASLFMKGYGDAIVYAESVNEDDNTIYSTYDGLASPFISALFFSGTDPQDFVDTVEYKDKEAEFLVAKSFTHYVFGLPEDILDEEYHDNVLIISQGEKGMFSSENYKITDFGNYAVAEYINN